MRYEGGIWIGLNDQNESNDQRWTDGNAVNYTNWLIDETDEKKGNCSEVSKN